MTSAIDLSRALLYIGSAAQVAGILTAALGIRDVRRFFAPQVPGIVRALRDQIRFLSDNDYTPTKDEPSTLEVVVWKDDDHGPHNLHSPSKPNIDELADRVRELEQRLRRQHNTHLELIAIKAEDQARSLRELRNHLSDYAGGGLRLQALGVTLLLIGTVLSTVSAAM